MMQWAWRFEFDYGGGWLRDFGVWGEEKAGDQDNCRHFSWLMHSTVAISAAGLPCKTSNLLSN